jgi:hemoglobin/transferrin/lactoferrin receptor protein
MTRAHHTLCPLLLVAGLTSLPAQDLLRPLIVTATRLGDPDAPYSVSSVTGETLRDQARRTLPEALEFTPGVLVQKTTQGHGSPFIRGFTGRQNLLLVDGIRLNNSTWRSGPVQYWNTVDPLSLDHFELVRSQGSVIYGSDAIGGTLNAFTRSADFAAETPGATFTRGSTYYEYRSNGEGGHTGRIEARTGFGGAWGLHLGLSGKDFGDIRDDSVGLMRGTGYTENAFDARFDMRLGPGTTLTAATQTVNQDDISRWHRTTANPGWIHGSHVAAPGTWLANRFDQERSLSYLRVTQDNPSGTSWLQRWSATLSYQTNADSELQDRRNSPAAPFTSSRYLQLGSTTVDTLGADLSLESAIGGGTLVYGFDAYHDRVASRASRNSGSGTTDRPASRPVADDADYDLLGLFANYTWSPAPGWEFSAGERLTHARTAWGAYRPGGSATDVSGDNAWTDLSGALRASREIREDWLVWSSISQSFRAPNLADLTGNTVSLSGLDGQGSPDVDPEKFLTLELGTRGKLRDDLQLQAAIFHTFSTGGAITSYTSGPETYVVNGEDSTIHGIEAEALWRITRDWSLSAIAGWQQGKTEVDQRTPAERWIPRMLPFTSSAALRYTTPGGKGWVEARVTGAVEADRIHPLDQAADNQRIPTHGNPAYLVPSLYAGWKANDHLDLTLALENLGNSDYRRTGSGNNEPGFGAVLGARLEW